LENNKNSAVLEEILKALFTVTGRRTSSRFADKTIGATIKSLEETYDFLKYIRIDEKSITGKNINIEISPEIDFVDPLRIGKAIEAIIRIVYTDLDEEAGLYFISELKKYAGDDITQKIPSYNVDLGQLQMEQHLFFQRMNRKKSTKDGVESTSQEKKPVVNQLGYTWNNVKSWEHESGSKYCTLYDEKGNVLDRLNLDNIIQSYVEKLSGYAGAVPSEYEDKIEVYEKEYRLLELMYEKDMDDESAASELNVTIEELNGMIKKLTEIQMLQYVSYDVVELTNTGMGYISKKDNKIKK